MQREQLTYNNPLFSVLLLFLLLVLVPCSVNSSHTIIHCSQSCYCFCSSSWSRALWTCRKCWKFYWETCTEKFVECYVNFAVCIRSTMGSYVCTDVCLSTGGRDTPRQNRRVAPVPSRQNRGAPTLPCTTTPGQDRGYGTPTSALPCPPPPTGQGYPSLWTGQGYQPALPHPQDRTGVPIHSSPDRTKRYRAPRQDKGVSPRQDQWQDQALRPPAPDRRGYPCPQTGQGLPLRQDQWHVKGGNPPPPSPNRLSCRRYASQYFLLVGAVGRCSVDDECRTVKVTDTEPYYIRAVPTTKALLQTKTPLYT